SHSAMDSIIRNQTTFAQIWALEEATCSPHTGNERPPGYDAMLQSRRLLPVHERYSEILDVYQQSQIMILSGETGSGKSTQVPQLLTYDEHPSGLQVACTQPRRLATRELASRVAVEMGVTLGEEVGYKVRSEQRFDENDKKTRLVYLTEGVLLRQLSHDRNLSAYACVIIDEAHERSLNADLLMALLKKVVSRRKDFKVVIMSATMDAAFFQRYFNNCPLVQIPGRRFRVETFHVEAPVSDYIAAAAALVMQIHKGSEPGHILVFLPGKSEIEEVCKLLDDFDQNLEVLPLHGSQSSCEQSQAINCPSANRKCIVSTNIAETSLTIDGVVFVIDSGLSRQMIFNPRGRMNMLELRSISQAAAAQRAGRAGRTRNGFCYRLYTREAFNLMEPTTEPAIRREAVDSVILDLVNAGYRKIADFDWIDAPHPESLLRAVQDLKDWKFLRTDGKLTTVGKLAAMCPLEPIWYRAIEIGADLGCSTDIVDIAVLCSSQKPIFLQPLGIVRVARAAQEAFMRPGSDHLTLLNAFRAFMHARRSFEGQEDSEMALRHWCLVNFLSMEALEEVRLARQAVGSFLHTNTKLTLSCASITDETTIPKTLAIAFFTHTAIHRTGDEYRTVHENFPALLSPDSALVGANYEWVVYTGFLLSGGRQCLQQATAISAAWIMDLPFFQEARLPKRRDGTFRQGSVQEALERARSSTQAATETK
ncbi:unnamed protein product, partial [Clonostachys byssicola]